MDSKRVHVQLTSVCLSELLDDERLPQDCGAQIGMAGEPIPAKVQIDASPVVGPEVDGAIVDAVDSVVGQVVLASLERPSDAVGHRVDSARPVPV